MINPKTNGAESYISEPRLDEFIKLFEKRFGRHLSHAEALEKGMKLVRLMEVVYQPIAKRDRLRLLVRKFIQRNGAMKRILEIFQRWRNNETL